MQGQTNTTAIQCHAGALCPLRGCDYPAGYQWAGGESGSTVVAIPAPSDPLADLLCEVFAPRKFSVLVRNDNADAIFARGDCRDYSPLAGDYATLGCQCIANERGAASGLLYGV